MSNNPNHVPRKKYFVNSRIQGRILTRLGMYWAIYHFSLWQSLFVFRYIQYRMAVMEGGESMSFVQLYTQFWNDYSPLLSCAGLLLPIFVWDLLKMTHRVAGPLVRFQNTLKRLEAGETVPPIKLREGDLLTEFQDAFNNFMKHYEELRAQAMQNQEKNSDLGRSHVLSEDEAAVVQRLTNPTAAQLHDTCAFEAVSVDNSGIWSTKNATCVAALPTDHVLANHFAFAKQTN